MNAKHAKELRAVARQFKKDVPTTYIKHRSGRLINFVVKGRALKIKLADSLKVDPNCTRGYYRALKKLYRTPKSVRLLYG